MHRIEAPSDEVRPVSKQRVLVVEDHPLVRSGVVELINRQEDLLCCGEAETPDALFAAIDEVMPDLVLLDLRLGEADGLEVIKSLHARFPALPLLVLSQYDEKLYAERSLRAGARGYVMKQNSTERLLEGIHTVLQGELFLSQEVIMQLFRRAIQPESHQSRLGVPNLTARELLVFRLLGGGAGTRQIAAQLDLSSKTVEAHRENIKHKLGLTSASALVEAAETWVQNRRAPGSRTSPADT